MVLAVSPKTQPSTLTNPFEVAAGTLRHLDQDDWRFSLTQAKNNGQVSEATPRLWAAYRAMLQADGVPDSPEARGVFFKRINNRLYEQSKTVTGEYPKDLPSAMENMQRFDGASETEFRKTEPSLTKTPAKRRMSGRRVPSKDVFVRNKTKTTQAPQRDPDEDTIYSASRTANSPEEAATIFANDASLGDTPAKLKKRAQQELPIFAGKGDAMAQRAYVDFLRAGNIGDSPENQKTFVSLLNDRQAYAERTGERVSTPDGQRRYYADTALGELRKRSQKGPLVLGKDDTWMISALSDPALKLSPADQAVADRVEWQNAGLTSHLYERRAERARQAEAGRVPPGAPYATMIPAESVFAGDPQVTAFRLAAANGGYSEQETSLAAAELNRLEIPMYVNLDKPGQPLITKFEDANIVERNGQPFVSYRMDFSGSMALLDARRAQANGYGSVQEFRAAFEDTWARRVSDVGEGALDMVQRADKYIGLDTNSYTGPLVRGKYDAMRELILVGSNAANFAEMGTRTFAEGIRRGDLMYNIKGDDNARPYFDASAQRIEQTFVELGRTYPAEESSMVAQFARSTIGSVPKIAVSIVPGAAIYYNALKHANHDMKEFGEETAVDLLSLAGGFGFGRVGSTIVSQFTRAGTKVLPSVINGPLAQATVRQVLERGSAGVGGATLNVATSMGPTYLQEALLTDEQRAAQTPAERRAVNEKLSTEAFKMNVWSGLVMGVVLPPVYRKNDMALLSKADTRLLGPVFRTKSPGMPDGYYAAVRSGTGNKSRVDFIQGDANHPKFKTAIQNRKVVNARQSDVDLAVADSRFSRLDKPAQRRLILEANEGAAKIMLGDADIGVQRVAQARIDAVKNSEIVIIRKTPVSKSQAKLSASQVDRLSSGAKPFKGGGEIPGQSGGIDGLPKSEQSGRYLQTMKLGADDLPYPGGIRKPLYEKPRTPPGRLEDFPQVKLKQTTDVFFASNEHSGSAAAVRLAELEDGRPVAARVIAPLRATPAEIDAMVLRSAQSAQLMSDLGIGPKFHGVFRDSQGRAVMVTDIARGDFPSAPGRTQIGRKGLEQLDEAFDRMNAANLQPHPDFQFFIDAQDGLNVIDDAVGSTNRRGRRSDRYDPRGVETRERLSAVLATKGPDAEAYLVNLRKSRPRDYEALMKRVGEAEEGSSLYDARIRMAWPLAAEYRRYVREGGEP